MNVFDKNRKRVKHCPCGKSNKDGKFIPWEGHDRFGFCHGCCKSFFPEQGTISEPVIPTKTNHSSPTSFVENEIFEKSLNNRKRNKFYQFLVNRYGIEQTDKVFDFYKIGTSKRWPGATIFWQIDRHNKIRTGKVMLYNPLNGKRKKGHNDWVHTILQRRKIIKEFHLNQCLFGLHLLSNKKMQQNDCCNNKFVAIVESEKTACIMSILCPNITWMACGGLSLLNYNKIKPLSHNKIILFPDLAEDSINSPFRIWSKKAKDFSKKGIDISVSDILEKKANEIQRMEKWDVADFMLFDNKSIT